jgi:predicted O-methyltransferase YrrM
MVFYNLSHLTQPENQKVIGPIQDDEALFLYSLIKGSRMRRILEIGGLSGYSAMNFLSALDRSQNPTLYTVDFNPVPVQTPKEGSAKHKIILKNAVNLTSDDLDGERLDLVFFDCHDMVQIQVYENLVKIGIIDDKTVIALHDTNLHYEPHGPKNGPLVVEDGNQGRAHQTVERIMVNLFKEKYGYYVYLLHTGPDAHNADFPFRHGVAVCRKFRRLQ